MRQRDALVDALLERHELALLRVDHPYTRTNALLRLARSLGALGRWPQAASAMERAVALDDSYTSEIDAAEMALEAASAGQTELAQRLGERLVRPVADEHDDEDAGLLACFGAMQTWLGHSPAAAEAFARLRELPTSGSADLPRVVRALLGARHDEELRHHLAVAAGEVPGSQLESTLVPVVRDWIERHGVERASEWLGQVTANDTSLSTERVLGLVYLERGEHAAAIEKSGYMQRHEQLGLWQRLSTDERARMVQLVADRLDERLTHGRLPAIVEDIALLARIAPEAARPRIEKVLAPRADRMEHPVMGKKITAYQIQELARAAESCGVAVSALDRRATAMAERFAVAFGRLLAHRHGDAAWKGLRDEVLASMAAMSSSEQHLLSVLEALDQGGDGEAALVLAQRIEEQVVRDPAALDALSLPLFILMAPVLRVRWQTSDAVGRAAPEVPEREASLPFVVRALIRRGHGDRALALIDSLADAERLPAITGALDEVARPQEHVPML